MGNALRERLLEKGWHPQEVDYTLSVLRQSEEKKSKGIKLLETITYWLSLILAVAGNLIISIALIPFFLVLHAFYLYLIVMTLGIGFGFFFEILFRDLEKIVNRTIVMEAAFIPALALINVGFMTTFGNFLSRSLNLSNIHNPLLMGLIYAIAFIGPWFYRNYIAEETPIAT